MTDDEIVTWADRYSVGGGYSCSTTELTQLLSLAKRVPDGGSICEIGVLYGRSSTVWFLEQERRRESGHPPFDLHLVDSWVLNEGDTRPAFEWLMEQLGFPPFTPHWKPSQQAVDEIPMLDLLFIDGDHTGGAWDDSRLYLPKVKVGGVVVYHDYGDPVDYPEVQKAVDACIRANLLGRWEPLPLVDRLFMAVRAE